MTYEELKTKSEDEIFYDIARNFFHELPYNGDMDEFFFWIHEISAEEIRELFFPEIEEDSHGIFDLLADAMGDVPLQEEHIGKHTYVPTVTLLIAPSFKNHVLFRALLEDIFVSSVPAGAGDYDLVDCLYLRHIRVEPTFYSDDYWEDIIDNPKAKEEHIEFMHFWVHTADICKEGTEELLKNSKMLITLGNKSEINPVVLNEAEKRDIPILEIEEDATWEKDKILTIVQKLIGGRNGE